MMRKMLRYALWSLAAFAAASIAIVAILISTFDPNDYRVTFENAVSQALERDVLINGELELVPALVPTLAVNNVTIANPPWASRPTMATVGRLEVRVALRPLLDGQLRIKNIVLDRVDASLERNADGVGNWRFDFLSDADEANQFSSGFETEIDEIELREIDVNYRDSDGTSLSTRVGRVSLYRYENKGVLIEAEGELEGVPIRVDWRAGPSDNGGDDPELLWPISVAVELGDTSVSLSGRLQAPMAYTRSAFDLRVRGDNAGQLQALFDLPRSEGLVYDLGGHLRVDSEGIEVDDVSGSLTNGNIFRNLNLSSGRLSLRRGERIAFGFKGEASGQDFEITGILGRFAQLFETGVPWPLELNGRLGNGELRASGEVVADDGGNRAHVSVALSGELLEALNRVRSLGLPELGPLEVEALIDADPSQLAIGDMRVSVGRNTASGNLTVSNLQGKSSIVGRLDAASIDLSAAAQVDSERTDWLERPLPLDWLNMLDAAIDLRIDDIRGLPMALGNVSLGVRLRGGALALEALEARVAGTRLTGEASLSRQADAALAELSVHMPNADARNLLLALSIDSAIEGSIDEITLTSRSEGATIGSLVRGTDAHIGAGPIALRHAHDAQSAELALATARIDAESGRPLHLSLSGRIAATLTGESIDEAFDLSVTAGTLDELLRNKVLWPEIAFDMSSEYRNAPLRLDGRIMNAPALLSGSPADVEARGMWGPLEIARIDGVLAPTASLAGTSLDADFETQSLAAVAELLGLDAVVPDGPVSVAAVVSVEDQELSLTEFSAVAPGLAGTGELRLSRGQRPKARGRLDLSSLDLTPYLAGSGEDEVPAAATTPLAPQELLSAEPLNVELLRQADIELDVAAETLRLNQFVSNDVRLALGLEAGRLELEAALDGGRMSANASMDAREESIDLSLDLSGERVPLIMDRTGDPAAGTPVIDLTASLGGRGTSSLAIAESLHGDLLAYLTGGRIESSGFRFLFGSVIYETLSAINPFAEKRRYVDIECMGAYFDVTDGVISSEKGIVVQTPELQVVGVGSNNLATGELAMEFRTKRRTGIVASIGGIVNDFVRVTGTIEAPRIEISPSRAARTGLLAIATGGISLLATDLLGRMTSGDVCSQLPELIGAPGAAEP